MQFFVGIICFFVTFRFSLPKAIFHARTLMKPFKLFGLLAAVALLLAACSNDDEFPDNVLFRNGRSQPITVTISVYENGHKEELQSVYVEAYGNRSIRLNPGNYYCGSRFFQVKDGYRAVFSYYISHDDTFDYERL